MDQPLHTLLHVPAHCDGARLDRLCGAVLAAMPTTDVDAALAPHAAALTACLREEGAHNARKAAACCRVLGRWGARAALQELVAALRHREAVVRQAAAAALRGALGNADEELLRGCPWSELLLDESMWVHAEVAPRGGRVVCRSRGDWRQAQALFMQCLARRHWVPEPHALLTRLLGTVDAGKERAVIRLAGALLREPAAVKELLAPHTLVSLLMERFVAAQPPSLECSMALEVVAQCQPDERLLRHWVATTLDAGQLATAVALLVQCPPHIQQEHLAAVLR